MKNVKIIAMYLPQFYQTPENDKWWGYGFTDWKSVRTSQPLFASHNQPRVPLYEHYYDLSNVEEIKWQSKLAKEYGISAFAIYHYWFSAEQVLLTKPAELIKNHPDIDMDYFFVWDNGSWVRSWSRYKHNTNAWSPRYDTDNCPSKGILAKLEYGDEEEWKKHFLYLLPYFNDERYIKIDNKPLFSFFNYNNKTVMKKMCRLWDSLSKQYGFDGLFIIGRLNPFESIDCFDALFTYEPMFSAWQNKKLSARIINKLRDQLSIHNGLTVYNYDEVWKAIIQNAEKRSEPNILFGCFVGYDDTPRRGKLGRVILGETPEKFEKYLGELVSITKKQGKEYVFVTAWNEWGEGAYLEPDITYHYMYLDSIKRVIDKTNDYIGG